MRTPRTSSSWNEAGSNSPSTLPVSTSRPPGCCATASSRRTCASWAKRGTWGGGSVGASTAAGTATARATHRERVGTRSKPQAADQLKPKAARGASATGARSPIKGAARQRSVSPGRPRSRATQHQAAGTRAPARTPSCLLSAAARANNQTGAASQPRRGSSPFGARVSAKRPGRNAWLKPGSGPRRSQPITITSKSRSASSRCRPAANNRAAPTRASARPTATRSIAPGAGTSAAGPKSTSRAPAASTHPRLGPPSGAQQNTHGRSAATINVPSGARAIAAAVA